MRFRGHCSCFLCSARRLGIIYLSHADVFMSRSAVLPCPPHSAVGALSRKNFHKPDFRFLPSRFSAVSACVRPSVFSSDLKIRYNPESETPSCVVLLSSFFRRLSARCVGPLCSALLFARYNPIYNAVTSSIIFFSLFRFWRVVFSALAARYYNKFCIVRRPE